MSKANVLFFVSFMFAQTLLVSFSVMGRATDRVWITPSLVEENHFTFHWQSDAEPPPPLFVGPAFDSLQSVAGTKTGGVTRAMVEGGKPGSSLTYRLGDGPTHTLASWDPALVRIVIVGDWHGNAKPGSEAILRESPHLLVTVGDNVTDLHQARRKGRRAYELLIDSSPELFASIPVLPISGNHDREIRPRGSAKPDVSVYDIDAKIFREFFDLPELGWRWSFPVPHHPLTLVALDLHHVSDFGTTWQSCQPFDGDSEQLIWLRSAAMPRQMDFRLILYNERNATVRRLAGGAIAEVLRRSPSAAVTGYGGFGERAEWEGLPSYNTHIHGKGTDYPDPHRVFSTLGGSYLLVTHRRGEKRITIDIKSTDGAILDTRRIGL